MKELKATNRRGASEVARDRIAACQDRLKRSKEPPVYRLAKGRCFACSNIHNPDGARGRAGARTHVPRLEPGERAIIAQLEGPALITRFWLTFDWPDIYRYEGDRLRNRAVGLEIAWDGAETPAISAPVGDFFGHPLSYNIPFENAWFGDPVGRSSLCFIPMPFRKRATVTIVNGFDRPVTVFHDIRFDKGVEVGPDDGYLHACFNRTIPEKPGPQHAVLPCIRGRGRYLGTHLGIIADRLNPLDWHNGNIEFFLDGDGEYPSMMGPSLDDYGGSAWLYDAGYMHRDSGLILSRKFSDGGGHYGMYFYHRRDPVYFESACAVFLRPAVYLSARALLARLKTNPALAGRLAIPHAPSELERAVRSGEELAFNCGRLDDLSTVALYYLDRPEGGPPPCSRAIQCQPAWRWPSDETSRLDGSPPEHGPLPNRKGVPT